MIGRAAGATRFAGRGERPGPAVEGGFTVIMVLPFILALLAGLCALARQRNAALVLSLATVAVQVWWLVYHATDKLAVSL
jgi:hypothetical protein